MNDRHWPVLLPASSAEKRGHSLVWFSMNKSSASRNPQSLSHKPSKLGLSPEGPGESLEVFGKGATQPDLCF